MPALVVAFVAAVGGWVSAVSLVVGVVSAAYAVVASKKLGGSNVSPAERKQLIRSTKAAKRTVLGEGECSGVLMFAATEGNPNEHGNGEIVHLFAPMVGHYCDQVTAFYLGDDKLESLAEIQANPDYPAELKSDPKLQADSVSNADDKFLLFRYNEKTRWEANPGPGGGGSVITYYDVSVYAEVWLYHTDRSQHPNGVVPVSLANVPGWGDDMRGEGISFAHVKAVSNSTVFPSGLPVPRARFKGTRLYDPRTTATQYSDNLALAVYHLIKNKLNAYDDEINQASFIEAANICDEQVTVKYTDANGVEQTKTEKRYRVAGIFEDSQTPREVLSKLEAACGGELVQINGEYHFHVGAYQAPGPVILIEDNIIKDVRCDPYPGRDKRFNTVTGTYFDAAKNFVETDFTPVVNEGFLSDDGEKLSQDLNLEFCPSFHQARRVAGQLLYLHRRAYMLDVTADLSAYDAKPQTVIRINIAELGLVNAPYRVLEWNFNPELAQIRLTLREELAANYVAPTEPQPYLPPRFDLNSPSELGLVSGVSFSDATESDNYQGVINWPRPAGAVRFKVELWDGNTNQVISEQSSQQHTYFYVDDLNQNQDYFVKITPFNSFGATTSPTLFKFVPGLAPAPVMWIKFDNDGDLQFKYQRTSPGAGWAVDTGDPISVKGNDGQTTYTWIKYADDINGSGLSDDESKPFIGLAYNKTTATESTQANDYKWKRLQGLPGSDGDGVSVQFSVDGLTAWHTTYNQGVDRYRRERVGAGTWSAAMYIHAKDGDPGQDAPERHTWLVFSNSPSSGTIYRSNNDYKWQGVAYDKASPTQDVSDHGLYQWSQIKPELADIFSQAQIDEMETNGHGQFSELSALSGKMGTVTGGLFRTAIAPNARAEMTSEGVSPYWFAAYEDSNSAPTWAVKKDGSMYVRPNTLTESMLDETFVNSLLRTTGGGTGQLVSVSMSAGFADNLTITLPTIALTGEDTTIKYKTDVYGSVIGGPGGNASVYLKLFRGSTNIANKSFAMTGSTAGQTPTGNPTTTGHWAIDWEYTDSAPPAGDHVYKVIIDVIYPAGGNILAPGASNSTELFEASYQDGSVNLSLHWDGVTGKPATATRWATKAEVGLSNVPNYAISNAYTSSGTNFASRKAVYDAYTALNNAKLDKTGKAASAGLADQVLARTSASASAYNILWHSGNNVYSANGKLTFVPASGRLRSSEYIAAARFYPASDLSCGYFYNDSGTRVAFTGGDFYIQSGVANTYIYSTKTYLGADSGDSTLLRGSTISGDGWSITGAGAAGFQGNVQLGSNYQDHVTMFSQSATAGFKFTNPSNKNILMHSYYHGGYVNITAENSSGTAKHLFYGNPDSYTILYYAGSQKLITRSTGIEVAGTVNSTGDVAAYYSDERLKEVTEHLDGLEALQSVISWDKVRYRANDLAASFGYDKTKSEVGLLAGQVSAKYPELTPLAPFDMDENGESKTGENYKTLQYHRSVTVLAAALEYLTNQLVSKGLINDLAAIRADHP